MDAEFSWEKAQVGCPNCSELLTLRPGRTEVWCQRCEAGFEIREAKSPSHPDRLVLLLAPKRAGG